MILNNLKSKAFSWLTSNASTASRCEPLPGPLRCGGRLGGGGVLRHAVRVWGAAVAGGAPGVGGGTLEDNAVIVT